MKLITETAELEKTCSRLAKAAYITVDTEFMRDRTYWPRLCLIQLASDDVVAAVDPLSEGIDLSPVFDLMTDRSTLKVFHAARQDIEIFYHLTGEIPRPLFDTQIAAMVCGFGDSVGYDTLVAKLAKTQLDKSARFTDWAHRPLSDKHLEYALGDVIHLRTVYEKLNRKLEQNGRRGWLEEEMDTLTNPATYENHPEDAWRRLKPRSRNRKFLGTAKALAAWREQQAQKRNVPRNRIMRDDVLLKLASSPPRNVDALMKIKDLPKNLLKNGGGQEMLKVLESAPPLDPGELPEKKPGSDGRNNGAVVELLKVLLKHRCKEEGVAQKLVATVAELEEVAADDRAPVAALRGWRREIFGSDALALKRGEIALCIDEGKLQLIRPEAGMEAE